MNELNENTQNILDAEPPKVSKINRRLVGLAVAILGGAVVLTLSFSNMKPGQKEPQKKQEVQQAPTQVAPSNIPFADYGAKPVVPEEGPYDSNAELGRKLAGQGDKVYVTGKEAQSLFDTLAKVNKRLDDMKKKNQEMSAKEIKELRELSMKSVTPQEDEMAQDEIKAKKADVLFQNISFAQQKVPEGPLNTAGRGTGTNYNPADYPINQALVGAGNEQPKPEQVLSQNMQSEKREFASKSDDQDKNNYLAGRLKAPMSPYEVKAGMVIPCTLITGLNSDLPGPILAQVRENVYDTVEGRYLLIPQGTRILGEYDSVVAYGQERLLVIFSRLIMPNGHAINLESMPGLDLSGYSGLKDRVNHHWLRLISGVILSSLVSASANYASNKSDNMEAYLNALGENTGEIGQKIAEKNLNIQPTIEIRPGWNFNVFVHKDMILKPYRI